MRDGAARNSYNGRKILYVCTFILASLYVVHTALVQTSTHIDLNRWIEGHERLPFQRRALLIPFLHLIAHSPSVQHFASTRSYVLADPINVGLVVIDFLSLLGCGLLATWLYDRGTHAGRLRWAPSALMLVLYVFTAAFRYEARFIFPYDMLSMFFFTLGLYLIYRNRIWPLFLLFPVATLNRESTVMWIPLFLLAGFYRARTSSHPRQTWIRTGWISAAMTVLWVVEMHWINSFYPGNDRSEDFPRFFENLHMLTHLREWDQLFSLFAFTLPFALLSWRKIDDPVLRSFFPIVPIWVAVIFYQGVITEGRVFSELIPYYAVIAVLIFEHIYMPRRETVAQVQAEPVAMMSDVSI